MPSPSFVLTGPLEACDQALGQGLVAVSPDVSLVVVGPGDPAGLFGMAPESRVVKGVVSRIDARGELHLDSGSTIPFDVLHVVQRVGNALGIIEVPKVPRALPPKVPSKSARRRPRMDRPQEEIVCRCNGVTRSEIQEAVSAHGSGGVQAVATETSAGASCGSCRPRIARLLGRRDERCAPYGQPVCGCTGLDHETVRQAIRDHEYASVDEVMSSLGWVRPDGCARCRPAITFYLSCDQPELFEDDPQSRVVNERMHANIQRDGTYSVVPRIFGGVVQPTQLRALADVADRYHVPMVKLTGAQRIDLLGIAKETLPSVWSDLVEAGFVSGHAYARAVRNVKTCVGTEFCRYGVGDAIGLGVALEEMCWGAFTPHKFKMAISACARNCAEATTKDFGAVAVEGGWHLYVGGGAGMQVRPAKRLSRVRSDLELIEHTGAFLQLYREEGWYGERVAAFIERVGIDYARERIAGDPCGRGALFRRLDRAQHRDQADPWRAHLEAKKDDFVPLARLMEGRPS